MSMLQQHVSNLVFHAQSTITIISRRGNSMLIALSNNKCVLTYECFFVLWWVDRMLNPRTV